MSANTEFDGEAPILRLDNDILWIIFEINTNLFEERGQTLESLRAYSQVCPRWRSFLLQCGPLWARNIDLRSLVKAPSHLWRTEVVRRTLGHVLWIKGSFMDCERHTLPPILYFLRILLDTQWHRVQILDVVLPPQTFDPVEFLCMFRPAPKLQIFRFGALVHWPYPYSHFRSDKTHLFADNAPCLRELNASRIQFSLNSPWLSNLRILFIGFPVTIESAILTLNMTPVLENLELYYPEADTQWATRQVVTLPTFTLRYIRHIRFNGHPQPLLTFFKHVQVSDGCSVELGVAYEDGLFPYPCNQMRPLNGLSQVIRGHLRRNDTNGMEVAHLYFGQCLQVVISDISQYPKIPILSITSSRWAVNTILTHIFTPYFTDPLITTNVSTLELTGSFKWDYAWNTLLCCFKSVRNLRLQNKNMEYILNIVKHPVNEIFPSLTTLVISCYRSSTLGLSEHSMISVFLENRRAFGSPLKRLNISQCNIRDSASVMFLEKCACRFEIEVIYPKVMPEGPELLQHSLNVAEQGLFHS